MLGFGQNTRAMCTNMVVMHGDAFYMSVRHKVPHAHKPGLVPVARVSRFERGENVAIHLYGSITSAVAMSAFGGVACGTGTGLKFAPLYLHMRTGADPDGVRMNPPGSLRLHILCAYLAWSSTDFLVSRTPPRLKY